MRRPDPHARTLAVFAVIAVLFAGLVGRLGQMQATAPAEGAAGPVASEQVVHVPAPRGRILDRHGVPIADNAVRLDVTVDRGAIADLDDGGRSTLRALASALRTTPEALADRLTLCGAPDAAPPPRCWPGSAYVPVTVAEGVSPRLALGLGERAERYPGVAVVRTSVRRDRQVALAPQTVGYLAPADAATVAGSDGQVHDGDLVGQAGLEARYDDVLRGQAGSQEVLVDPRGVVTETVRTTDPVPGQDLLTTLDATVQRRTQEALARGTQRARARGLPADEAAAVVVDLRDGGVVASASVPTYDPAVWTGGISQADYDRLTSAPASSPLTDRVIAGVYPPASTFKVVSLPAAVAPQALDERVDCASSVRIGDRTFRNFESRAYGPITWRQAISVSCDTVFYKAAERIWTAAGGLAGDDGKDTILRSAQAMGLGEPTGIDLPGEGSGRLPGREWKRMADFDVLVLGAGPGGYVAAIRASQLGKKVAVVEKKYWGGVCLNVGCIPSKALLKNAELAHTLTHEKAKYGIEGDATMSYGPTHKRSRQVSAGIVKGVHFLMKKNKITEIDGWGTLTSATGIDDVENDGARSRRTPSTTSSSRPAR
jgi:penicillin-binding protein 2